MYTCRLANSLLGRIRGKLDQARTLSPQNFSHNAFLPKIHANMHVYIHLSNTGTERQSAAQSSRLCYNCGCGGGQIKELSCG